MEGPSFGFAIAFTAGLLSFLSPCVLPLIPSYVTFITGLSLEDVPNARAARRSCTRCCSCSASRSIFVALGASATALGRLLAVRIGLDQPRRRRAVIVFGLYLLGVFNLGAVLARAPRAHRGQAGRLSRHGRSSASRSAPDGRRASARSSVAFSPTPRASADLARGCGCCSAYSLGLAVPFLLAAVAVERFLVAFDAHEAPDDWITRMSGALLVVVGMLMITTTSRCSATSSSGLRRRCGTGCSHSEGGSRAILDCPIGCHSERSEESRVPGRGLHQTMRTPRLRRNVIHSSGPLPQHASSSATGTGFTSTAGSRPPRSAPRTSGSSRPVSATVTRGSATRARSCRRALKPIAVRQRRGRAA